MKAAYQVAFDEALDQAQSLEGLAMQALSEAKESDIEALVETCKAIRQKVQRVTDALHVSADLLSGKIR